MMKFIDVSQDYAAWKEEIDASMQSVLTSGEFILGPVVTQVERSLEKYLGVAHCISCSDGTTALQAALMALDIGPGDEVVTVPYTWISSAEVIETVGATTVFCDVERSTFNMDVSKLEACVTKNTKAIIVVSLYGQMADVEGVKRIADKFGGVTVIEDAAQSFGAVRSGRKSGSFADISTTSFFPTKPLGCFGDGGAIFTNSTPLAEKIRATCRHGATTRGHHWRVGLNARLDALQAAVLAVKLRYIDETMKRRNEVGRKYTELLQCIPGVTTPYVHPECWSVYAQYTIQVNPSIRELFMEAMKQQGVPCTTYYGINLHEQPVFRHLKYEPHDFPAAMHCSRAGVSLPMHQWLTDEDISRVVKAVAGAIKKVLGDKSAESPGAATTRIAQSQHRYRTRFVAVVGAGYWGKNHVRTFHELGALHTICDSSEEILAERKAEYPDVTFTADLDQVLSNVEITAVALVVPAPIHHRLARKVLLAGKHLLVEKPFTTTVEEAQELHKLASDAKVRLMVGHLLQYHACFQKLLEMVRVNAIGEVSHVTATRMGLGQFRQENVLWSLGVHDVSMILELFRDTQAKSITCQFNGTTLTREHVADSSTLVIRFESGQVATIVSSWVSHVKSASFSVVGTAGMLVFDDTLPWEKKLTLYGSYRIHDEVKGLSHVNVSDYVGKHIQVAQTMPLTVEITAFCDAVLGKLDQLLTDSQEGVRVMQILCAAEESATQGKTVFF